MTLYDLEPPLHGICLKLTTKCREESSVWQYIVDWRYSWRFARE